MSNVSLYDLSHGFDAIMDLALDDTMDLDELEAGLQQIEADVAVKVSNGIGLIRSLENYADGMKAEADRLTVRRRAIENRVKSIKEWYQQNLEALGKDKVQTERGTMSIRQNPPRMIITDSSKIPAAFLDVIPEHTEISNDRLKDALKKGDVPGACLERRRSLQIR